MSNLYYKWHASAKEKAESYAEDFFRSNMNEEARYKSCPWFQRLSEWAWFVQSGFTFEDKDAG